MLIWKWYIYVCVCIYMLLISHSLYHFCCIKETWEEHASVQWYQYQGKYQPWANTHTHTTHIKSISSKTLWWMWLSIHIGIKVYSTVPLKSANFLQIIHKRHTITRPVLASWKEYFCCQDRPLYRHTVQHRVMFHRIIAKPDCTTTHSKIHVLPLSPRFEQHFITLKTFINAWCIDKGVKC